MPDDIARRVEHVERDFTAWRLREPVVDDHTLRRIERVRYLGREGRVGTDVSSHAVRVSRLEEMRRLARDTLRQLPQRRDIIQYPEAATVRGDNEIVVLDHRIPNGSVRQILLQRLVRHADALRHFVAAKGGGALHVGDAHLLQGLINSARLQECGMLLVGCRFPLLVSRQTAAGHQFLCLREHLFDHVIVGSDPRCNKRCELELIPPKHVVSRAQPDRTGLREHYPPAAVTYFHHHRG